MRDIALALFIFGTIPYILMRPYVGLPCGRGSAT
ncbi:hypothetical protein RLIN73S_00262 [Rhodanobacter lindaniclasticus]